SKKPRGIPSQKRRARKGTLRRGLDPGMPEPGPEAWNQGAVVPITKGERSEKKNGVQKIGKRPNSEALRKCILSGPYKPTTVLVHVVEATNNSPAVPEHMTVETPTNMSPEKEAIHLILTGIGDDIYSTVDACQTVHEMWEAIERLQQGESLNIQDVKTNLFWEFGKFTSHDGETIKSYYTRFYKLMNEMIRNNLTVTTMQVNV
nr:hypothetical protein [Tanacetum cinerariifolium]